MATLTLRTNEVWGRYEIRGRDVIIWSVEKHDGVPKGAFRRFLPLFAHHLAAPDSLLDGLFDNICVEDVMSEALVKILNEDEWSLGGIVPRNEIGRRLLAMGVFEDPSFQLTWSSFLRRYCE